MNCARTHTHTRAFNGFFRDYRLSRYQRGKTKLDFTEARDSEWQWHQLGNMQVCTSLQTDNPSSTPPLSFLQADIWRSGSSLTGKDGISKEHVAKIG